MDPWIRIRTISSWIRNTGFLLFIMQFVVAVAGCPCARALVLLPRVLVGPVLLLQGTCLITHLTYSETVRAINVQHLSVYRECVILPHQLYNTILRKKGEK